MATKYDMQDVPDNICCISACTIMLEKCYVHMPCSLNDLNLAAAAGTALCYCALHKHQSNKPFVAYCPPYSISHKMSDVFMTVQIFRDPELCVQLVHKPTEVEMGFISKPQAVKCCGVLLHKL